MDMPLSTTQRDSLMLALDRGQGGFTESELMELEKWVKNTMVNDALLKLIFKRRVKVKLRDDAELVFFAVD